MGFHYKNVNSDQKIYSEERRDDLARSARWEESEGSKPRETKPKEVELPEGDPTDKWDVKQLDAWAEQNNVDLGEAKSKKDKFEAIEKAREGGWRQPATDETAIGGGTDNAGE